MQFVSQIDLKELEPQNSSTANRLLLIFMCQNDPGMCDDWDANCGGNAAILVPYGSASINVPTEGETLLSKEMFAATSLYDSSVAIETDDDNFVSETKKSPKIFGKIGGNPLWLQGNETPSCSCSKRMSFVAMLEERCGVNFGGGGIGYAFLCDGCESNAKFLWQS